MQVPKLSLLSQAARFCEGLSRNQWPALSCLFRYRTKHNGGINATTTIIMNSISSVAVSISVIIVVVILFVTLVTATAATVSSQLSSLFRDP